MSKDKETVSIENSVPEITETQTTVITEKKKNKAIKEAKKPVVPVMYIGPNIVNVVQKSTVFKDGVYSNAMKELLEKYPYIQKLLIPVDSLADAMKELAIEKSALSVIYNKVKNLNY